MAVSLSGCTLVRGADSSANADSRQPTCRQPGELTTFAALGGAKIGYEAGGGLTSMRAEPAFLARLEKWAQRWTAESGLGAMKTLWSYGAYTDKCGSWHQVGRAFDIARIEHAKGTVSCRFDQWGPGSAKQLKLYWRLAASLHRDFQYTICYPYNSEHANHIHVDNSVNGDAPTTFDPTSQVQAQLIQNACRHVFGVDAPDTGQWDDATRDALRAVQRSKGITRPVSDQAGWKALLDAIVRG